MLRAVVDTNVWISGVLNPSGPPAEVRIAIASRRFELVTCESLLEELAVVLSRPYFARKYRVTAADIESLMQFLRLRATIVPIIGDVCICRDPKDDVVIEVALRGEADVIVTRDDDLKSAVEVIDYLEPAGVEVLSVQHFLDRLRS